MKDEVLEYREKLVEAVRLWWNFDGEILRRSRFNYWRRNQRCT
jgi:hypothetical protein